MQRLHIALIATGLLAAFVAVLLVIEGGSEESPSERSARSSNGTTLAEWEESLLHDAGREAREEGAGRAWPYTRMQEKPGAMSAQMRQAALSTLGGAGHLDLNFNRARFARTPRGRGVWMVNGTGVTCLFQAGSGSAACNTSAVVKRKGLMLQVYWGAPTPHAPPTKFLALGVAPDWARAVRFEVEGGASATVSVHENAYAYQAGGPIQIERLIRAG